LVAGLGRRDKDCGGEKIAGATHESPKSGHVVTCPYKRKNKIFIWVASAKVFGGINYMTDSTIATKAVENWIRNDFLAKKYHQVFTKRKLGVQSGGEFECDAVSEDGKIVCFISTSSSKTADGKPDADALGKIREKALWALSLNE
jgi:hypothetical protein